MREEIKNVKVSKRKDKKRKIMLSSKCAVCDSRNSRFIKEQGASGLLSSLGIRVPLGQTPLVGPILY